MRANRGRTFPWKACARCTLELVGGSVAQQPDARLAKTAIASENAAVAAENRSSGKRRDLIVSVGFTKGTVRYAESAKTLHALAQLRFVRNAANDEMGVGQVRREEEANGFDGRMAGLDNLMGVRKVLPHEDIDIR